MTERSWPWDGTTVGDASLAPYDAAGEWAKIQRFLSGSAARPNKGGVFFGHLNGLACTTGGGVSPVSVATGAGISDGTVYETDAIVNVAIPTPAASTRIDRVVLRKSWAAQTVRITRIAGTEGAAAPALVQSLSTTWDVPLCRASITTGGVITITDDREHASPIEMLLVPTKMKFDVVGSAGAVASAFASKYDHIHEIDDPGVASTQVFNDLASEGTGLNPARSDHKHTVPIVHRKYKTVDLSATGALDADLQFPVTAGERYIFEGVVAYDTGAGGAVDLLLSFSIPGSSTYNVSAIGPDVSTPTTIKMITTAGGILTFGVNGSSNNSIQFRGTITIGSTGIFGLILAGSLGQPNIQEFSHLLGVKI